MVETRAKLKGKAKQVTRRAAKSRRTNKESAGPRARGGARGVAAYLKRALKRATR